MKSWYWFIIIAITASIFRLFFLDLAEFKMDEAYMLYKMSQFFQNPEFFLIGSKNSAGVHNFPLIYYVFILLTSASRDPQVVLGIIAFINVLAITLFYYMVKRYYGNFVGVTAGLFLSLSPWAIIYSREIWTPDLIIPFAIPLFFFLHKLILDKNPKAIMGVAFFGILMAQWHATGIFLCLAVGITVIIFITIIKVIPGINWRYLFLGLVLGLLPTIPFFVHQFSTTPACGDCFAYFKQPQKETDFNPIFFTQPFKMVNAFPMPQFLGNDTQVFIQSSPVVPVITFISLVASLLLIVGIVYIIRKRRQYLFLLLLLGISCTLYTLVKASPYDYYILIIAPIVFIIYTLGVQAIFLKKKALGIIVITIIIIINVIFEISFYSFLNQKKEIDGVYGPIYRLTYERLRSRIEKYANDPDYDLKRSEAYFRYYIDLNPEYKQLYND